MSDNAIVESVMSQLEEMMTVLDGPGAEYARSYIAYVMRPDRKAPPKPADMHRHVAAAVREIVMDTALAMGQALPVAAR